MKKLIYILILIVSNKAYSQLLVEDASVAGLLGSLQYEQTTSNSRAIAQATSTVKQLQSQGKWIKETVEKVDNAVKSLQVISEVQQNAVGVVKDYQQASRNLKSYKKLNPQYVQEMLNRLAGIISKNQKTVTFFTDIMKSDFLKLSSFERIKLLEDINQKIIGLRGGIHNINVDAMQTNQSLINSKSIYGTPTLK